MINELGSTTKELQLVVRAEPEPKMYKKNVRRRNHSTTSTLKNDNGGASVNGLFGSFFKPLFHSKAKCKAMKMIFDPQANINSFSQECFYTCPWFNSDSFGTQKCPIRMISAVPTLLPLYFCVLPLIFHSPSNWIWRDLFIYQYSCLTILIITSKAILRCFSSWRGKEKKYVFNWKKW